MKELKFRAYLKQEKEMYEVFSFCDKFIKVIVGMGSAWKLDINEFEPIMQFTGLDDKNGKHIYEGDIVKYYQPYSKRYDIHTVLWDERFAGFGLFKSGNEWCQESDWLKIQEIEVLGNIYENPELL